MKLKNSTSHFRINTRYERAEIIIKCFFEVFYTYQTNISSMRAVEIYDAISQQNM